MTGHTYKFDIDDGQHQSTSPLWWHRWRVTLRRVNFVTFINIWTYNFLKIQIVSNQKLVYTKVVGLNQIYNFVVQNFFSWGCFGTQIYGLNFKFSKFSNDLRWKKKVYTNVVARHQICNFVVKFFFHLRSLQLWNRLYKTLESDDKRKISHCWSHVMV